MASSPDSPTQTIELSTGERPQVERSSVVDVDSRGRAEAVPRARAPDPDETRQFESIPPPKPSDADLTRQLEPVAVAVVVDEDAVTGRRGMPDVGDASDEEDEELTHGDFVGRYSVLSRLGRGGMGVVYKAYDPQLDRNVAIKLLRRSRSSVEADLRLLREAQTLAKLKHRNVVAVHDAGLTNHGVFIAMELLDGCSLNAWLEQTTRRVSEILAVFRAAGRGLVAAHEAGFVHRDFKPSNVNVDEAGEVKVLDFGLAHLVEDAEADDCGSGAPTDETRPDHTPEIRIREAAPSLLASSEFSTKVGTVMGTPAFMAPEQILGERTDQRSEQFSFAMSLYVALYDRSPLGGATYEERQETMERGLRLSEVDLERSSSGERVPLRVRRVIVRGLANDPQDRFDSMSELLAQLEEPRRRWREIAAVGTLLVGFGVGAMVFDGQDEPPCSSPEAALDGVWSDDDRSSLFSAFERHAPGDERSVQRVFEHLDDYSGAWIHMYEESCRATYVSRQQSEQLFDQRMRCLQRRRNRLRSAIDSMASTETREQFVQHMIAPFKLPTLEPCADLDFLMAEQPLPDDEAGRQRVSELRQRIDEITTLNDVGDFQRGIEVSDDVLASVEELGYQPLLAETLEIRGMLFLGAGRGEDGERALKRAIRVGAASREERAVAAAWTHLIFAKAQRGRLDEGLALELPANAAVDRLGDDVIRSWLYNSLGYLHSMREEYETALEYLESSQKLKIEALGPEHVDVGISWLNLGNALMASGANESAEEPFSRARDIFGMTIGPAHPLSHFAAKGLGRVLLAQGKAALAVEAFEAARTDFESASPGWIADVSFSLARAKWLSGSTEAALTLAREVRAGLGPDAPLGDDVKRWLEDPDAYEEQVRRLEANSTRTEKENRNLEDEENVSNQ